ncbi:MAG: carboxypeptidase-like regulatory domain-containing protein, partial [Acidimicrobiia bacterium]
PDYRAAALPAASGRTTTTTVVMGPGRATVRGRVVGPEGGPVVGAVVRVERLVGDAAAGTDLLSGEDGAWSLPGVLGGRYRIRAWRSPDLAMVEPAFVFVGHDQTAPVEQQLGRWSGTRAVPAIAPSPPTVGEPAALVVQVSNHSVDAEGVVRATPVAGVPVEVAAVGAWAVSEPAETVTDPAGEARWEVVCRAVGAQPLRLVVNGVEPFEIALPACLEPPAPAAPPPDAGGATTTTRAGAATTTTRAGVTMTRPATATTRATTTTRPR